MDTIQPSKIIVTEARPRVGRPCGARFTPRTNPRPCDREATNTALTECDLGHLYSKDYCLDHLRKMLAGEMQCSVCITIPTEVQTPVRAISVESLVGDR